MGLTTETVSGKPQGLRTSSLRRPFSLWDRDSRIIVDPDSSIKSFDSLSEKRALFGLERFRIYKVQAGVVVQAQRPDWNLRLGPRWAQFSGRVFDSVEVSQTVEFFRGSSSGFTRRMSLRNLGSSGIKLRLVGLFDPTAAQFGGSPTGWGSLGLNAFNRGSHVAMDEVSDPPSARVVGAAPPPLKFYMTADRSKALGTVGSGELPDATAGMSGQVLILSLHELDLAAGESKDIVFASIYNPKRLEDALSDFGRLQGGEKASPPPRVRITCSSPSLTEAASWALARVEGALYSKDPLDGLEVLKSVSLIEPDSARRAFDRAKESLRKDGSFPHSLDPSREGVLETALLLQGLCWHLLVAQDRKLSRSFYPLVRKVAVFLSSRSKDYSVRTDPSLPQGWRRLIGRGYPTGEIPEVSLAAAGGLAGASQVARQLAKSADAGKFREAAEMVSEGVRRRLLDERGFLSLCLESNGRLRTDETIDMAVASYRYPFLLSAEQASSHRLLEKDFETPYGPRCVPKSNQVYFNGSYGSGQLGGFWTRAALAHVLLCYRLGLAGIGSLGLKKVAKLVTEDFQNLAGSPGDFPYWVNVEGREVHGEDSDPVAASRLLEGLFLGELGLTESSDRASISPPASSSIGWILASDFWAGEKATVFVGRAAGKHAVFFSASKMQCREGAKFSKAEPLLLQSKGVTGVCFHGPGQAFCLGNGTGFPVRTSVTFPPRGPELSKKLNAPLETYDPDGGSWGKVDSLRITPTMSFEASLGPNEWKAFRISPY
jgi:hypothetical protein